MKAKFLLVAAGACAVLGADAIQNRPVGMGPGAGQSIYATDQFPGFDELDDLPKNEKKETSWFLHVSAQSPAGQWKYVEECLADGSRRAARRGCDALVREWPSDDLAPKAQLELSRIWEELYEDYEEAFAALDYLLEFYPYACTESGVGAYADLVQHQYYLTDRMVATKKNIPWRVIPHVQGYTPQLRGHNAPSAECILRPGSSHDNRQTARGWFRV